MTELMTAMIDYLQHCQQYLHLHLTTWPLPSPSVFNAPFLPDVPQFEPEMSQLQNEPTDEQQKQVHFSIIKATLKPEEEKPKMSNKLPSLFP